MKLGSVTSARSGFMTTIATTTAATVMATAIANLYRTQTSAQNFARPATEFIPRRSRCF